MPAAPHDARPEIVERRSLRDAPHVDRLRVRTADGALTTAHVARHARSDVTVRIERLDPPRPVAEWAADHDIADAISGGFYVKPDCLPLGELRLASGEADYRPFESPWDRARGCLWLNADQPRFVPLGKAVFREGDQLLQAGPLLLIRGEVVVEDHDPEGFSTTAHEFDQDFSAERLPRMAIAVTDDQWLGVAVDGRGKDDAGLLLTEFASLLATLGATDALNLDGGSSSALVAGGRLRNTPRDDDGNELPGAQPTPTTIDFAAASASTR
jgi:Phosphodiester glycosidase